jgi:hypothetical protein
VGDHEPAVDAEAVQGVADEAPERVGADAGDQRGPVAQTCRCDGDIGGAAAEELAERLDVLKTRADLEGVDVHAAAPDGEDVENGCLGQG